MMTGSSNQEQTNQVGTRLSDHESNTAVVEIRLTRDEEIIHTHNQGVQVPSSSDGFSSYSMHMEESIERFNMPNMMLQLDGPTSVRAQRGQPLPITRRTTIPGSRYPDDSDSDSHNNRFCENRRYLGKKDIIKKEVEDHQIGNMTRVEVIQEGEDPLIIGDHLMMEDPQ